MSRYDGLIIPRSYSEYINKTDAATIQQVLQLSGVLSRAVAAGDNKAVTSDAVYGALTDAATIQQALQLPGVLSGAVAAGDNKAVTSDAVYGALTDAATIQQALQLPGVLSGAVAAGDNKPVKSSAVNAELSKYKGVLEKTVNIKHGNNVHTLVNLDTNGTYLLHASGNNFGGYLGFVTNGYSNRTEIKELYHISISAVVSGFKTLDFTSYADGDVQLSIVRF